MKKIRTPVLCTLAIVWMVVIFIFSAQPAENSSAMSSPIAETVVDVLYPAFETLPNEEQFNLLDTWTVVIRKGAHFTEYAILGLILALALSSYYNDKTGAGLLATILRLKTPLIALLVGIVYAASDELHQLFVSGRSGQLTDVLLDSCGVLAGVLFVCLLAQMKSVCRKRQTQQYNVKGS